MEGGEEEYEEASIPNYDMNISLSPPGSNELDWDAVLMDMINKSEDGSVPIPARFYEDLVGLCKFNVSGFIYDN